MAQRLREPANEIARLKAGSDLPPARVDAFLESIHHIIDCLVGDDVTVIAPPLIIARVDDPVWERIRHLVKDKHWEPPEDRLDSEPAALAAALRLPVSQLELYPVIGEIGLLGELFEDLGLSDDQVRPYMKLMDEWLESYATSVKGVQVVRQYRVAPAGKESLFEDWLIENLEVLADLGLPVRLASKEQDGIAGRQGHLTPDSRPDLVTRFTEDIGGYREGDWLVIENKTTPVDVEAGFQLERYVDWLRHRGVPGEVYGHLIADGRTVALGRALKERGFTYTSLTAIGYRDVIRGRPQHEFVLDADRTAAPYAQTRRYPTAD